MQHTPGPWHMTGPMGTGHLKGREPWFWVTAERTLHLQVAACSDGYVIGENEANARLIAAAPDLLECLRAVEVLFAPHCKDSTQADWLDKTQALLRRLGAA